MSCDDPRELRVDEPESQTLGGPGLRPPLSCILPPAALPGSHLVKIGGKPLVLPAGEGGETLL